MIHRLGFVIGILCFFGCSAARAAASAQQLPLTAKDVRHGSIDVTAQFSLMRLSRSPDAAARADAHGLLEAVKSGRLAGIWGDDLGFSAKLAKAKGIKGWWLLVGAGKDARLAEPPPAPPAIVFKTSIRKQTARLDAALRTAFHQLAAPRCVISSGKRFGGGGATCTTSTPEEEIDKALADTTKQHQIASFNLNQLADNIDPDRSLSMDPDRKAGTLAALQRWLKINPSQADFLARVKETDKIVGANEARMKNRASIAADDAACRARTQPGTDAWAMTVGRNIKVCQLFFSACLQCRSDVLAHEFFHLGGFRHMNEVRKQARGDLSTADSRQDADSMAQLISDLAKFGVFDSCVNCG